MHDWKPDASKRLVVIFREADLFGVWAAESKDCQIWWPQGAHDVRASRESLIHESRAKGALVH
jgi:uncharacterized protein YaeQ